MYFVVMLNVLLILIISWVRDIGMLCLSVNKDNSYVCSCIFVLMIVSPNLIKRIQILILGMNMVV